MLGEIVAELSDRGTAADVAAAIGPQAVLDRIEATAAAESVTPGAIIATRVRHVIENGGEDIWVDLIGVMAGSPQPGAAALQRILAYAFPDPVRVRISRSTA